MKRSTPLMMDNSVSPRGFLKRPSRALGGLAVVLALAAGLLFLLPGGLVWAQDADGPIMYAENGTGPVATYTAVDPEGDGVTWTLAGGDATHFTIVGGVLRFGESPNFEAPADTDKDNTYVVMVNASDGAESDTENVVIEVTNVDEPGTVTLSTLQPQVEVPLTATLSDSDVVVERHSPTWMWFRGSSVIAGAVDATYTPMPGDVGSILEAKATYMDGEDADNDKTAEAASVHAVRAKPETNIAPAFPTLGTDGTDPDSGGGGEHAFGTGHRSACCSERPG